MTAPARDVDAALEAAFEAALDAWLARQAAAEERLTSFAFREGQPAIELPAPTSRAALSDWILATVADRLVAAFLHEVDHNDLRMADLAAAGALGLEPGDRVALAARVGVLAASGLVARDLERDSVTITDLGRAALNLVAPTLAAPPAPTPVPAPAPAGSRR